MALDAAQLSLHPPELVTLLDRATAGDQAACAEFFDRYAPAVFRFVSFRFDLDDDDADDVVLETMQAALTSLASFDRARKVTTWLFGIATNKAWDLRRARSHADVDDGGRVEVPWSALVAPIAGPAGRGPREATSLGQVEAALGGAAEAGAGSSERDAVPSGTGGASEYAARAGAPAPAPAGTAAPFATWARDLGAWLAVQPPETQIIARRFTHGAEFADLAADLSALRGSAVTLAAVRQRASRFAQDFRARFAHLLPRPSAGETRGPEQPTPPSRAPVPAGSGR